MEQNTTDTGVQKCMHDLGLIPSAALTATEDVSLLDPTVLMHKEHLGLLIARGKTKEFIGKTITYAELDKMSPKELDRNFKLYEAAQASRINQSVTNGVINLYTQLCGLVIKCEQKQLDKLNADLRNDFLVTNELENWTSYFSYKLGPIMSLVSAGFITFENIWNVNGGNESGDKNGTQSGDKSGSCEIDRKTEKTQE